MTELPKRTLTVLANDTEILLGLKKKGFGSGKINGFGGKPEPGETMLDCVLRETQEEAGVKLDNPYLVAVLDFFFVHKPEWNQQVHVFRSHSYSGEPSESEEMAPQTFLQQEIPYGRMWVDDKYWMPLVLAGKKVRAKFTFAEDGSILKYDLQEVDSLDEESKGPGL